MRAAFRPCYPRFLPSLRLAEVAVDEAPSSGGERPEPQAAMHIGLVIVGELRRDLAGTVGDRKCTLETSFVILFRRLILLKQLIQRCQIMV